VNRLDPSEVFDDAAALDALALNTRLACYGYRAGLNSA